jgi:aspartyl-tRNA(Asn)/glutamyl-tRNA(Gln) amidotransferase subunit C
MLDEKELKNLEKLSRLKLSEVERDQLLKNLKTILSSVEKLNEIDTSGVEPLAHVLESMQAPLREDIPNRVLPRELFLSEAPDKIAAMLKVPPVIKEE